MANVVVVTEEVESGHLDTLRRWDERLGYEQMRQVGEGKPLGRWELEAGAVVERVAGERGEARVPHQRGIQGRIGGKRRPTLIARARPMGADDAVVVDADGHGLRVAKAVRRRVTTAAGVVVVQAANNVKPEQAAEIGPLAIDRTAQFLAKPGLDVASESLCCQDTRQLGVEPLAALRPRATASPPNIPATSTAMALALIRCNPPTAANRMPTP